ncbi:pilus assembly protein TadG-related protein [Oerskovia sp. Root918]|uniref:pilus assembly protein TadG-related protein n=1 Tax=Oerskovia sp. Root918 TaxID=1736607 RepID=UPI0012F7A978|nr:pilus assembly protein TadG-related protein [Oerskovia sp. Root918]
MLLTSMFVAFALVLVAVVVSASEVHLDRKRLFDLADASALDAADAMPAEAVYQGGLADPVEGAVLVLSDADVESSVRSFLVAHPATLAGLDDVTIVEASTPDGRTATVRLAARSRPVLVSWVTQLWSDGIIVRAESSARAW